jgi:endonuclease/exonuclease/phosphatase family metal-dependent hydrolase
MTLSSPRVKNVKRTLAVLAVLLAFVLGWWVVARFGALLREVKLVGGEVLAKAEEKPLTELRVIAWNIAHGRGPEAGNWGGGGKEVKLDRLRRMGRLLKDNKPDLVVLNEVDFDSTWSSGVNQAEVIARELGMANRAEGRNVDASLPLLSFRFGNAVLSRFPITDAEMVDLPAHSGFESFVAGKKKGLLCTLELPGKKPLRVLAVHLEHRSEAVRVSSARLIERARMAAKTPLVAAGDFNTAPEGYPHVRPEAGGRTAVSLLLDGKGFRTAAKAVPGPEDFTFPATKPDRAIDWVFAPPDWIVLEHKPLDSRLSDHRPVLARLRPPAP